MFYFNTRERLGNFYRNPFRLADGNSNTHIPILGLVSMKSDFYYYFPSLDPQNIRNYNRTSKDIITALQSRLNLARIHTTDMIPLYFSKGLILDSTGKILFCLTVKRTSALQMYNNRYFYDTYYEDEEIGYSNMVLFLATELVVNPSYDSIYKMLQKNYLGFCYEKGVEVRILSSHKIEQNTFANEFKIDFNTISEMDYCLKNVVKLLLRSPDEYFINHPLFIKGGTIPLLETIISYPSPPADLTQDVEEEFEDLPF